MSVTDITDLYNYRILIGEEQQIRFRLNVWKKYRLPLLILRKKHYREKSCKNRNSLFAGKSHAEFTCDNVSLHCQMEPALRHS